MTTTAFHGTAALSERMDWGWRGGLAEVLSRVEAGTFVRGPGDMGLFYVAPTAELAARYANAQATRTVDATATRLGRNAAVIEFAVTSDIKWSRRAENHASLDLAEATVDARDVKVLSIRACVDARYIARPDLLPTSLVAASEIARRLGVEITLEAA